MPKNTFLNLPDAKKEYIIEKSIDLFIKYKYEDINIRLIVKELGISIGSFYQYFDDKDDLYLYLFVKIEKKVLDMEKKKKGTLLSNDSYIPIEEVLTEREIKFDNTWYDIPIDVMRKFYFGSYADELFGSAFDEFLSYFDQGKLNPNLDVDFIYFIYTTIMFNILIYFRNNNITDIEEKLRIKKSFYGTILLKGILNSSEEIPELNITY